ncbi:hypothetical protein OBBRIDRAFT_160783 [Obba rivulosa]|uniref:Uncharacterized protein n=1 Tax=Obba rivulosa TaxID=1052685 RepID=A0A8E2DHQ7_9APHY|nr:hypothetical protein OBBRIDRAFT_160783 [Obba rivulosa]
MDKRAEVSQSKFAPRVVLNLDILCYLMWFLERRELMALMMTCHALHSLGTVALFALPIDIRSERSLSRFCTYMRQDLRTRSRRLKKIALNVEYNDSVGVGLAANLSRIAMKQIIGILCHAHYLEELDITVGHYTLKSYPELSTAIESLQKLRLLSLTYPDNATEAAKLLSHMQPLNACISIFNVSIQASQSSSRVSPPASRDSGSARQGSPHLRTSYSLVYATSTSIPIRTRAIWTWRC